MIDEPFHLKARMKVSILEDTLHSLTAAALVSRRRGDHAATESFSLLQKNILDRRYWTTRDKLSDRPVRPVRILLDTSVRIVNDIPTDLDGAISVVSRCGFADGHPVLEAIRR